jgi:hypothetical protein
MSQLSCSLTAFLFNLTLFLEIPNGFYRNNVFKLQAAIQQAGGAKRAVDIIEQALVTGKPVKQQ